MWLRRVVCCVFWDFWVSRAKFPGSDQEQGRTRQEMEDAGCLAAFPPYLAGVPGRYRSRILGKHK